jgi:hypothetical protein
LRGDVLSPEATSYKLEEIASSENALLAMT